MELKVYDKQAKIYEIKFIKNPNEKKIKFFTDYNLGKNLNSIDFFEIPIVFAVQKVVLIIRVNSFLETVEIHKCFFDSIEQKIQNDKQYNVISSFLIDSIEIKSEKTFIPYFLDSQYFYLIINQDLIQYNLASLLTNQGSKVFFLQKKSIRSPIYFREDFIYILNQQNLYQVQRYGRQINCQQFIFNMAYINLEKDDSQNQKFQLYVNISENTQNNNLIQLPYIQQITFEMNKIMITIFLPFENFQINQHYCLNDNSEFHLVYEEVDQVKFNREPGILQMWEINQNNDQLISLKFN